MICVKSLDTEINLSGNLWRIDFAGTNDFHQIPSRYNVIYRFIEYEFFDVWKIDMRLKIANKFNYVSSKPWISFWHGIFSISEIMEV